MQVQFKNLRNGEAFKDPGTDIIYIKLCKTLNRQPNCVFEVDGELMYSYCPENQNVFLVKATVSIQEV